MASVCMGRGQQLVVWLLGLLGACSPGTVVGRVVDAGGAGKWPRGEPATCLGLAVPLPLSRQTATRLSSAPCCQQGPPSKDTSYPPDWVSGWMGALEADAELWSRWTRARRA